MRIVLAWVINCPSLIWVPRLSGTHHLRIPRRISVSLTHRLIGILHRLAVLRIGCRGVIPGGVISLGIDLGCGIIAIGTDCLAVLRWIHYIVSPKNGPSRSHLSKSFNSGPSNAEYARNQSKSRVIYIPVDTPFVSPASCTGRILKTRVQCANSDFIESRLSGCGAAGRRDRNGGDGHIG
jgi:hypothetical protein